MSKPQITIKDIARELGVSPSTVSRALKDNPDISQETRDAIHKYAREHNYKPNVLALNLRTSRSNTIGVIIPQLVHHFFSCVLSGIERTAGGSGLQHPGGAKQRGVRAGGKNRSLLPRRTGLRSHHFARQRHIPI